MEYAKKPLQKRLQKIEKLKRMRFKCSSWLILILMAVIIFTLCNYLKNLKHEKIEKRQIQFYRRNAQRVGSTYENTNSEQPNVKVYDLTKPLDRDISESIKCMQTREYHDHFWFNNFRKGVSIDICLHDIEKDFVSKTLLLTGLWEDKIVRIFMKYVKRNPNWLVIDAGSQLGQYSLLAAKLGARVIAFEPFYDSVVRIHKSAIQNRVTNRITLIQNALFNKRNEIKLLSKDLKNYGAQSLKANINQSYNSSHLLEHKNDFNDDIRKYYVETILLDDMIPLARAKGLLTDKAIMKIDIEGLEPYVIPTGKKLFEIVDIQLVFMEWGHMPNLKNRDLVVQMIGFFLQRDFVPYSIENKRLSEENSTSWPWDIYWIKKDLIDLN